MYDFEFHPAEQQREPISWSMAQAEEGDEEAHSPSSTDHCDPATLLNVLAGTAILLGGAMGIGLLVWCAWENLEQFLLQMAFLAILLIAGWVRSNWDFLEARVRVEFDSQFALYLALTAAGVVALGAIILALVVPNDLPPVLAAWLAGASSFAIGSTILLLGLRLTWRDLERGLTYKPGNWVGETTAIPSNSPAGHCRIAPCDYNEEPVAFYCHVANMFFAALLGAAIFMGLPLAALFFWWSRA